MSNVRPQNAAALVSRLNSADQAEFVLFIVPEKSMGCYSIDWGTVPQWLTFGTVLVGIYLAYKKFTHSLAVRETENILKISDSTIAHNAAFLGKKEALTAIQMLEGLNIPTSESDSTAYWAARGVHLSHVNLIWRVWELGGRPGPGGSLDARFDGWQRFARMIVVKKLKGAMQNDGGDIKSPAELAASDLWSGLNTYEVVPTKFVGWLASLDDATRKL